MKIIKFDYANKASDCLAHEIYKEIKSNPSTNLGLATGRTMDAVYHRLVQINKENQIDFSKVNAFALDEYIGLESDDPQSFESYLNFHVYSPLSFNLTKTYVPNVHVENLDESSLQYEKLIKDHGGIDLQILGIGVNGHIGLNEPGSAMDSRTRVMALNWQTIQSNKASFKDKKMPLTAITMGIATILEAKRCILLATGGSKAQVIQKLVEDDISSHLPASFLKTHPNFTLIIDDEAAKLIS